MYTQLNLVEPPYGVSTLVCVCVGIPVPPSLQALGGIPVLQELPFPVYINIGVCKKMKYIFDVTLLDLKALKRQVPKEESSAHKTINQLNYLYSEYRILRSLYIEKRANSVEANNTLLEMLLNLKKNILSAHDSIFDTVVRYYV